jgi:hypothetical protein
LFQERKSTDVSQEMSPASARLKSKPSKTSMNQGSTLLYSWILTTEATCSSEMSTEYTALHPKKKKQTNKKKKQKKTYHFLRVLSWIKFEKNVFCDLSFSDTWALRCVCACRAVTPLVVCSAYLSASLHVWFLEFTQRCTTAWRFPLHPITEHQNPYARRLIEMPGRDECGGKY